jgi:hypothetical protein
MWRVFFAYTVHVSHGFMVVIPVSKKAWHDAFLKPEFKLRQKKAMCVTALGWIIFSEYTATAKCLFFFL